jgi:hypothetical protein
MSGRLQALVKKIYDEAGKDYSRDVMLVVQGEIASALKLKESQPVTHSPEGMELLTERVSISRSDLEDIRAVIGAAPTIASILKDYAQIAPSIETDQALVWIEQLSKMKV